MSAVVTATSLEKRYGETVAIRDLSLSVDEGEVFALIGPNGAGKTTLVRTLTGATTPTSGEVALFGERPTSVDHSRVGVLPQEFNPHERLTARELVAYYAGLYPDARGTEEVLERVGLDTASYGTHYKDLSGGQQRRICVGIGLINDPEILFLDEPTTGIDPAGRRAMWRLVEDLADAGTTVFLTTHYMEEAEYLADRVGLLADGELVATGTPQSLIEEYGGETQLVVESTTEALEGGLDGFPVPADVGTDGTVVFRDVSPLQSADVIRTLADREIEYSEMRWTHPTLEDVYLQLAPDDGDAGVAEAERDAPGEPVSALGGQR
ncbi:MAG: ABC transporter ATP-binding protein [Salinigranum sp.]